MHRALALRAAPRAPHGGVSALCPSGRRRFHSLGVSAELVERLRAMGITTPSAAQRRAIPLVLQRQHDVVVAAETGGGKTLAYLIPMLERLRDHPLPVHEIHRPVALVLTTSQELVGQIHAVLQQLDTTTARATVALSSTQQQLPSRGRACAVLVATPKALLRATQPKDFAFTQLLVVDEADMLLGGGFERDTKQIVATIRNQPLKKAHLNTTSRRDDDDELHPQDDSLADDARQTVLKYATIPDYGKRSVHDFIQYKFPNAQFAVTDDFQRTLPQLDVAVHRLEDYTPSDADPDEARNTLVLEILDQSRGCEGHTLVFANSIESADALHGFLATSLTETPADNVLLFHKEIPRDTRHEILRRLQQSDTKLVVVCTDIAARGLDTTRVGHVVQYEFANDVVSYIHRIGRTARAGASGKVSSIVGPENALVVSKIDEAGGDSLHGAFSRKRSLRKKVKKLRRASDTHRQ